MADGLKDTGEEFVIKQVFREDELTKPGTVSITLFSDATDALSDSDDLGDISTEPSGGSFSRQTASFGSSDFTTQDTNGDWEVDIADQLFDTSDSTQNVDAYAIIVNFQAEDTSDGSATDHLLATGSLDQEYNLDNINDFTLQDAGVSIT